MAKYTDISVQVIDHMGTDLTVANAARVSFNKESTWEVPTEEELNSLYGVNVKPEDIGYQMQPYDQWMGEPRYLRISDKDEKLIKYLATHGHWTPFSHCILTLRETVPIAIARQRFKHTVGFTYNEISRRYVDEEPEFFDVEEWRNKSINKKQGSEGIHSENDIISNRYQVFIEQSCQLYNKLIADGVAPEQARMVLPLSTMTSYYVTGSLYAFARAYKLRSPEDAQLEIRSLATKWNESLSRLFPVSWKYLTQK